MPIICAPDEILTRGKTRKAADTGIVPCIGNGWSGSPLRIATSSGADRARTPAPVVRTNRPSSRLLLRIQTPRSPRTIRAALWLG
jgi:hypothetical protein